MFCMDRWTHLKYNFRFFRRLLRWLDGKTTRLSSDGVFNIKQVNDQLVTQASMIVLFNILNGRAVTKLDKELNRIA